MSVPLYHHQMRRQLGISVQAEIVLDLIARMPRGCSHKEVKTLARAVLVGSPATLHKSIHDLIDAGLVKTGKNPRDARAHLLTVSADGKKLLKGKL